MEAPWLGKVYDTIICWLDVFLLQAIVPDFLSIEENDWSLRVNFLDL